MSIHTAAPRKRQTGFDPAAKAGHHIACRRLLQQYRPNSNSFIAWLTRHVPGLETEMPATAIGKDYLGTGLRWASTPSGTGWQISAWGLAGASLALEEGLELNVLGTTIGIDPKSLSVKLPALGAIGPS